MQEKLTLDYLSELSDQNIDIDKLRPDKSYDYLIENRNASMKSLLEDKDKLKNYLEERSCPAAMLMKIS